MFMIKKFAILSSAVVCLALTGCGSSNSNKAEEGVQESAVVEEASKAVATIQHGLWFSPSNEKYYLFYYYNMLCNIIFRKLHGYKRYIFV